MLTCKCLFLWSVNLHLFLIPLKFQGVDASSKWSYNSSHDSGPHSWHNADASWHCAKKSQSPVSISGSLNVIRCPWIEELRFQGYDIPVGNVDLHNNGHTVQLDFPANSAGSLSPAIFGSGLDQYYDLVQVHLHWGDSDKTGSEHALGNKLYPCEIHLVHVKRQYNRDVKKALDDPSGLAVLGVLCEISQFENSALQDILINKLEAVKYSGQKIRIGEVRPSKLLPEQKLNFFRYSGSLTTPSCNEAVVWTVFVDTIKISSSQLAQLRKLFHTPHESSSAGDRMLHNYRPVQPLNDRLVFYRTPLPEAIEKLVSLGNASATCSIVSTAIALLIVFLLCRLA